MVDELAEDVPLETHIEEDEKAHEDIRAEEDEDYAWLTRRLDALDARFADAQSMATTEIGVVRSQMADALTMEEANRQTIQSVSATLETMMAALTEMSASLSELSRLTPNNLRSGLQEKKTMPETAPTAELESASIQDANRESKSAEGGGKKRRRI